MIFSYLFISDDAQLNLWSHGQVLSLDSLETGILITSVALDFQVEVRPQATKSETLAGASIGLGLRAGTGGGAHLELQAVPTFVCLKTGYPKIPWLITILPKWQRLRIGKYMEILHFQTPA